MARARDLDRLPQEVAAGAIDTVLAGIVDIRARSARG
jgi:hypothetical protein